MIEFHFSNPRKIKQNFLILLFSLIIIVLGHLLIYSSISCFDKNNCLKTYCDYNSLKTPYKSIVDRYQQNCN